MGRRDRLIGSRRVFSPFQKLGSTTSFSGRPGGIRSPQLTGSRPACRRAPGGWSIQAVAVFEFLVLLHRLRGNEKLQGNEKGGRMMLGRMIPESPAIILPGIILPLSVCAGVSSAVATPPSGLPPIKDSRKRPTASFRSDQTNRIDRLFRASTRASG